MREVGKYCGGVVGYQSPVSLLKKAPERLGSLVVGCLTPIIVSWVEIIRRKSGKYGDNVMDLQWLVTRFKESGGMPLSLSIACLTASSGFLCRNNQGEV